MKNFPHREHHNRKELKNREDFLFGTVYNTKLKQNETSFWQWKKKPLNSQKGNNTRGQKNRKEKQLDNTINRPNVQLSTVEF
jgi:hypothetical protein